MNQNVIYLGIDVDDALSRIGVGQVHGRSAGLSMSSDFEGVGGAAEESP